MATLLIVDNDERIVELSAWFMRRLGHVVETANSYAAARLVLNKTWPDLMLADLDLGYERGQEELPKLANEGLLPATLVVSGFLDANLERTLRRIPGVRGTVAKPVDLKHLERLICHHLETGESIPAPTRTAGPQAADTAPVEEDADGWVEIAPLAPGIDPAPPMKRAPWEEGEDAVRPPTPAPQSQAPARGASPSVGQPNPGLAGEDPGTRPFREADGGDPSAGARSPRFNRIPFGGGGSAQRGQPDSTRAGEPGRPSEGSRTSETDGALERGSAMESNPALKGGRALESDSALESGRIERSVPEVPTRHRWQ
jgi:CheY-like chemotaxis protein